MENRENGISLIALIITIAIMIIIASVAVQKGVQRTNAAYMAKHNTNISMIQEEAESYYYSNSELPIINLTPYPIQLGSTLEAEIVKNGEQSDQFYVVDMSKMGKVSGDSGNGMGNDIYIISAIKHTIYYLKGTIIDGLIYHGLYNGKFGSTSQSGGLTPTSSATPTLGATSTPTSSPTPTATPTPINQKPLAVINFTPNTGIHTTTNITWSYSSSSDPDGDSISDYEWQLDSNSVTKSPNGVVSALGAHTMNLRVQDNRGLWSDWVSLGFTVTNPVDATPVLTSNNSPSPYVASASSIYSSALDAYRAFDGVIDGYNSDWGTPLGVTAAWLKLDYGVGNAKKIVKYTIYTYYIANPQDWTFEGSNDNSIWTVLDTQHVTTWPTVVGDPSVGSPSNTGINTFNITNNTAYRYYRINITSKIGSYNDIQISELKLYE